MRSARAAARRARYVVRLTQQVDRRRAEPLDVSEARELPLGAQQYVAALVCADPHHVSAIVPVPQVDGQPAFPEREWIHVQLMYV